MSGWTDPKVIAEMEAVAKLPVSDPLGEKIKFYQEMSRSRDSRLQSIGTLSGAVAERVSASIAASAKGDDKAAHEIMDGILISLAGSYASLATQTASPEFTDAIKSRFELYFEQSVTLLKAELGKGKK